jgi:hypothetical protein
MMNGTASNKTRAGGDVRGNASKVVTSRYYNSAEPGDPVSAFGTH